VWIRGWCLLAPYDDDGFGDDAIGGDVVGFVDGGAGWWLWWASKCLWVPG
jgi:hypothetical protein